MDTKITLEQKLALAFAAAWNRIEKRLDSSLGSIRGISFAEYRLMKALSDAPSSWASRVDLAGGGPRLLAPGVSAHNHENPSV